MVHSIFTKNESRHGLFRDGKWNKLKKKYLATNVNEQKRTKHNQKITNKLSPKGINKLA